MWPLPVPPKIMVALVAIAAAVIGGQLALHHIAKKNYARGYAVASAEYIAAAAEAQAAHDAEINRKQIEIDLISSDAAAAQARMAAQVADVQRKLLDQSNEDYLCPVGQPVFSDRLRNQLDAIGRD